MLAECPVEDGLGCHGLRPGVDHAGADDGSLRPEWNEAPTKETSLPIMGIGLARILVDVPRLNRPHILVSRYSRLVATFRCSARLLSC